MKTLIVSLFILLSFLCASAPMDAYAQKPVYLVSDPTPPEEAVTSFEIYIDQQPAVTSPADDKAAVKFLLTGLQDGPHIVRAKACNVWGCGADSNPFSFVKKLPGSTTLLGLEN